MASTRFRVSQFIAPLRERGIDVELLPLLDDELAATLYDGKRPLYKARRLLARSGGLLRDVLRRSRHDVVLVQREAALLGPPIVEAVASRAGQIPLVLDLDDATWVTSGRWVRDAIRMPWKASWLARGARAAIVGSRYLAAWARERVANVVIMPTVVPAATWTPRPERLEGRFSAEVPVIGWVGSHSTAPQLSLAVPALRRLEREGFRFTLRVVGAGPSLGLDGIAAERWSWSQEREIDLFRDVDIGLAPMFDGPWHAGKCAFKQIQYMAVGVPFVSSWVGGARDFVEHEVNGLVAHDEGAWHGSIRRLLEDASLRAKLAVGGRQLVERELCSEVMVDRMEHVLRDASGGRR
jgi:glycosyltransferase involved in cell wall biosynthesis